MDEMDKQFLLNRLNWILKQNEIEIIKNEIESIKNEIEYLNMIIPF